MRPPPQRRFAPRLAAIGALAGLLVAGTLAWGAGRRYHNDALRIADFEVPRGWTVAPTSPYPQVLLVATSSEEPAARRGAGAGAPADEARLLLAAQRVTPGAGALALAADARVALGKQGFGDPRVTPLPPGPLGEDRVRLDAQAPGKKRVLRQVYIVESDTLVVLTVTTPESRKVRVLHDFDNAVDGLKLAPPAQAPPPPAASAPDAGPAEPEPAPTPPSLGDDGDDGGLPESTLKSGGRAAPDGGR